MRFRSCKIAVRGWLALGLLLAGCGRGDAPPWAGTWTAPEVTLSLIGTAAQFSGTGEDSGRFFTVAGTPPVLSFVYADQTREDFVQAQPDEGHLTLTNASRTLAFTRDP